MAKKIKDFRNFEISIYGVYPDGKKRYVTSRKVDKSKAVAFQKYLHENEVTSPLLDDES